MIKLIVSLMVLLSGAFASADISSRAYSDTIKKNRVEMEKETEVKIFEKLEESRLRDEKARLRAVEGTSFNVYPPVQSQQVYSN